MWVLILVQLTVEAVLLRTPAPDGSARRDRISLIAKARQHEWLAGISHPLAGLKMPAIERAGSGY
jgi:hypothetical protein